MVGRPGSQVVDPLLVFLAVATIWDLRTRRVPNWLTFGAAAIRLVANAVVSQERGVVLSVSGWAVGIVLLLIPYLLGAMGAGDVKLLGTVGAWGGPRYALLTLFYGALVGGAVALVIIVWPERLGRGSLLHLEPSKDVPPDGPALTSIGRTKRYLTYAPALAAGGLIAFLTT